MNRSNSKNDKHALYQESVQNAEFETKFLQRVYRQARGQKPLKLREDFCGTALLASEWARRVKEGRSLGIDLHGPTLDWGRTHNLGRLGPDAERVELQQGDVLEAQGFAPDITVAFNFSYFVFKTRETLLEYFTGVREDLADNGIFVIDIYGGPEAQKIQEEETDQDGFTYVWDQAKFNPVTGDYRCYIHFDLPNGKRIRRAFTYDWRLWSLPEVIDVIRDAGFPGHEVYWEGTDHESGGGNGVFRPTRKGDDAESWVAYIVALK